MYFLANSIALFNTKLHTQVVWTFRSHTQGYFNSTPPSSVWISCFKISLIHLFSVGQWFTGWHCCRLWIEFLCHLSIEMTQKRIYTFKQVVMNWYKVSGSTLSWRLHFCIPILLADVNEDLFRCDSPSFDDYVPSLTLSLQWLRPSCLQPTNSCNSVRLPPLSLSTNHLPLSTFSFYQMLRMISLSPCKCKC